MYSNTHERGQDSNARAVHGDILARHRIVIVLVASQGEELTVGCDIVEVIGHEELVVDVAALHIRFVRVIVGVNELHALAVPEHIQSYTHIHVGTHSQLGTRLLFVARDGSGKLSIL